MIKVLKQPVVGAVEMRKAYCSSLIKLAAQDERIVVLDCDLSNSVGTWDFYAAFPERAINCGIQEANACAMAGGLSSVGLIPFVHSFAVFTSRRMCDQIFLSCSYARQNVKLIGCDAGVTASMNGGTHMAFEDFGVLRSIPEITLLEPTDPVMLESLLPQIASAEGVVYMRMPRKKIQMVYEEGSQFRIGQAVVVRDGSDLSIIAGGIMVAEALKAAEILSGEGIRARVVDLFTVKPADAATISACARETGAIVTAENHNVIGGIGSVVSEIVSEICPVPVLHVGVNDEFGEVGSQDYLQKRFNLTAEAICTKARQALKMKDQRN